MANVIKSEDFLVEIQTEELPPKSLKRLGLTFLNEILTRLSKAQLNFKDAEYYATPRRLSVFVKALQSQQADTQVERRGPAIAAAFDATGQPTQACVGFARSCGVTPEELTRINNKQGEFVGYLQNVAGKSAQEILPGLVQDALQALPIAKRMRWGNGSQEFVRPVHSVLMLFGKDIVPGTILGIEITRETLGHRFLSKKTISIANPRDYLKKLEKSGYVIADFEKRKKLIGMEIAALVEKNFAADARAVMSDELLDEVTGLVEWPVALLGSFDKRFLQVPSEALISAMQDHQRYFPLVDQHGKLLAHFITISNIQSKDEQRVIAGNERVLRARLSDAAFFYETDKKQKLIDRVEKLKGVVFQAKLGTIYDKTQRLKKLSGLIAAELNLNVKDAERAAELAKTDLTCELVGEFPELQGIAGYHYALHDGESEAIAIAIDEQYMPRFSGDRVPATKQGCVLALADRLDTLVGIFGINQQPTGDKDPFALRRAALGVLRILIERELDLDLQKLLQLAVQHYSIPLENKNVTKEVIAFILERLKPWYQEQGINPDVFASVAALDITRPFDFHKRINAVQSFKLLPDAESLSVANKRVSNILAKYVEKIDALEIDPKLFEVDAERELSKRLNTLTHSVSDMSKGEKYIDVLTRLADLRKPVDDFFEHVMVMTDDKAQRENRLLLLSKLRGLFLQVADVALLQTRSQ